MAPEISENTTEMARSDTISAKKVDKNWKYCFVKCLLSDIHYICQKRVEKRRLEAKDLGFIQYFYDLLDTTIRNNYIKPRDIWNCDETGFTFG